ncbi:zinc ion binding [Epicoccum nigrum]|nr:zinc ion binding [Epicoccum nigrum]
MSNQDDSNTSLVYTTPSSAPFLSHTPLPPLTPHTIQIKLHAAAINPVDIQLWANPLIGCLTGRKEKGLGRDYAGIVTAVGSAVPESTWAVGDRVFGLCQRPLAEGTFTRYLHITPGKEAVARMPACWGFEEAAAVPLVVLTAWACLDWLPASPEAGHGRRRVVVAGASGGVGTWCLQLAKKVYGCHVTAICSARNTDFVKGLGADEVVDYTSQDVVGTLLASRLEGRKYDLYIDCVGGKDVFERWSELLHKHAAYVTIVGDKTSRTAMGGPLTYFTYPAQVWRYLKGWAVGPRYANVLLYQKGGLLERVARLADEEGVRVEVQEVVKGVLSEEEYKEAWERVRELMVEGRVRGKIVVKIAD